MLQTTLHAKENIIQEVKEYMQFEATILNKDFKIAAAREDATAPVSDIASTSTSHAQPPSEDLPQPGANDIICGRDKLAHK